MRYSCCVICRPLTDCALTDSVAVFATIPAVQTQIQNHLFNVVIWGQYRGEFGEPERKYKGKNICVRGKINEYQGVPQIQLQENKYIVELPFSSGHRD